MSVILNATGGGGSGGRTVLTANTNYYVATTGSDSNPGTSALPWATLQHAINYISTNVDIANWTVIINVAAGTYVGFGAKPTVGGGNIFIKGAGTASTTLTAGPNDGIFNNSECASWYANGSGTVWWLGGINFDGSGLIGTAGSNVFIQNYNQVFFQDPTNLATPVDISSTAIAGLFHVASDQLGIFTDGGANITVAGNCGGVILNLSGAQQLITGNYTLSGAQAYSGGSLGSGFYVADGASFGVILPTIVSGTATGPQFSLVDGSVAKGVDPTTLPGSTPGTIDESSSWNGASGGPAINTQTASYQIVFSDAGGTIEMNAAGANNLTVPANATTPFPIDTRIDIVQLGAGKTTVVAAGGVTIRSASGNLSIASQYSGASLYKRGTNEWVLVGEIGP